MNIKNNLNILLDKDLNVKEVQFLGLKLGSKYKKIPSNIITEENTYETRWIRTNQHIHFRTKTKDTKKIIEVLLDKHCLKELNITSTEDLISKFGTPQEIENQSIWQYYFYTKRKMVVAWRIDDNELYGVYLGKNIIQPTTFTVHDFLIKYYEFKGMTPDKSEWSEKALEYNSPRYYRFLALKALMKAFDLGENLVKDFESGDFIGNKSEADFEPIFQDIKAYAMADEVEKRRYEANNMNIHLAIILSVFRNFMNFRETIRTVLEFNGGRYETMIHTRYIIHKTEAVLKTIDQNKLKEIGQLIALIIDPKQQSFTKRELIENYGFPDIDLDEIDSDHY